MTEYEIRYDIPKPRISKHKLGPRPRKYPLDKLGVGGCFFTKPGEKGVIGAARVYASKVLAATGHKPKFSIRRQQDGSYGVWRDE